MSLDDESAKEYKVRGGRESLGLYPVAGCMMATRCLSVERCGKRGVRKTNSAIGRTNKHPENHRTGDQHS